MAIKFNFNPKGTTQKDPGAFKGECELVSMIYTKSKKGNPMVKLTWKYNDCIFIDYHTCFDDKHKEAEIQWLGRIVYALNEDPQEFVTEGNPDTLDSLLSLMCDTITEQLKFKATIERSKRDSSSSFYDCYLDLNEPITKLS